MKRLMITWALLVVLLVGGWPVDAHPPYNQNVRNAREWLRRKTTDKAFRCANILWDNESHWNPRSGEVWNAYGIPQAYPGFKMRSAGDDWRYNATTQVKWGKRYVKSRYGTFCRALDFQNANGWY